MRVNEPLTNLEKLLEMERGYWKCSIEEGLDLVARLLKRGACVYVCVGGPQMSRLPSMIRLRKMGTHALTEKQK